MTTLRCVPCLNSDSMATARRRELAMSREVAAALGRSAVKAAHVGFYLTQTGETVVARNHLQRSLLPHRVCH